MRPTIEEAAHALVLKDRWHAEQFNVTQEQGRSIGVAYIVHVLGLSEEVAQRFDEDYINARHEVGEKQSGDRESDFSAFWQVVSDVAPNLCSKEDVEFLAELGGIVGVFEFMYIMQEIPSARILTDLRVNAHAYK